MPPRRCNEIVEYEPPLKKKSSDLPNSVNVRYGEVVTDITGKKWKIGKVVGTGGFGEIYQVSEDVASRDVHCDSPYVVKIERHTNGPLFVEINCYLRIAKPEMIEAWKTERKLKFLGMPHYVASGSHISNEEKSRFLVIPRYEQDLEKVLALKKVFNLKTVLTVSMQITDVLEYIHSHGYVHSDIKASNIMIGRKQPAAPRSPSTRKSVISSRRLRPTAKARRAGNRNLRPVQNTQYVDDIPYLDEVLEMYEGVSVKPTVEKNAKQNWDRGGDEVFLLDYGLATKYLLSNGDHKEEEQDRRRAHAGTLLFCSRDAHKGVPSRRSDLESLAYNVIYWLTASLPWIEDLESPEVVEKKKKKFFCDIKGFLNCCFNDDYPEFLFQFLKYLGNLEFEETPDYNFCRGLFKKAIKHYGYKDDSKLDFDNIEGWGSKQKKLKATSRNRENRKPPIRPIIFTVTRIPLQSNIIFKRPKLRKKINFKLARNSLMTWSKILMDNPEDIIKQKPRVRKNTEGSDSSPLSLDLDSMNPTPAMLVVYNRYVERADISPRNRGDDISNVDNVDGYTPEMMRVHSRMIERKEMEFEEAIQNSRANKSKRKKNERPTKKRKKCEVTTRLTRNSRSQAVVAKEKPAETVVKKVKSVPLKRVYSLRG